MPPRAAKLSEQQLQEQVVKLLSAYSRPDICFFAVPNGELRNWKVGVRLKAAGLRAGAADLLLLIGARAHALELKTEIGTLSARQHTFREDWERAGGFFHVAFGLDQALGVLQGIGAFRAGVRFSVADEAFAGAPSTDTHAADGLRVRKGSASGRVSRSPIRLAGAGKC